MELEWSRTESPFPRWFFAVSKLLPQTMVNSTTSHPSKSFFKKWISSLVFKALDFSPSHGNGQKRKGFLLNCIIPSAVAARWEVLILCTSKSSYSPPMDSWGREGADHQSGHPAMYSLVLLETWMKLPWSQTLTTWYGTQMSKKSPALYQRLAFQQKYPQLRQTSERCVQIYNLHILAPVCVWLMASRWSVM